MNLPPESPAAPWWEARRTRVWPPGSVCVAHPEIRKMWLSESFPKESEITVLLLTLALQLTVSLFHKTK